MLDLDWERSMPIIDVQLDAVKSIVNAYDKALIVTDFKAIQRGCKNSNFVVSTNKGRLLLRITNKNDFNNEIIAYELVKDKINIPQLLFHITKEQANIFIYQYINGDSLQKGIINNEQCADHLLTQVAKAAALMHNTPRADTLRLAVWDIPPFEMWYQYFLDNPVVKARLGLELYIKVQRLILNKQKFISEIDKYQSFIHCDFRPANMLVDEHNQIFFIDWEGACWGHSLADIGQFIRYRKFFSQSQLNLFAQTYNTFAIQRLPDNWFELSLFRDLVNPLQLLSLNQEAPLRDADLINIISTTVDYWGY